MPDRARLRSLSPRDELIALAAASLAARAAFTAASAAALGVDWKDLAVRYDGGMYGLIAATFPHPYVGAAVAIPAQRAVPALLTAWYPLYPLLIRAAACLTGDLRVAALLVSWTASTAAVLIFRRLAARFTDRPGLAAALFTVLPPMWLVSGSLALVEPVFVCAALAAVLAALEERPWACAAACSAAVVAQKSGILIPAIVALICWERGGRAMLRRFAPCLLAALPAAALQGYLWRAFGDPLVNVKTVNALFGGRFFSFPFTSFFRYLFESARLGAAGRRDAIAVSAAAYLAAAALGWRRRRPAERPLLIWLGVTLAFYFSLDGDNAFQNIPRFLLLGSPPALLLAMPLLPRSERRLLLAAPLVLLPFFAGLIEVAQIEARARAAGCSAYYAPLSMALR